MVRTIGDVVHETLVTIFTDGRTREAHQVVARRKAFLALASEEELVHEARLLRQVFGGGVEEHLELLKRAQASHKSTKDEWLKDIGEES